jgi:magnesium chelatase subunit D
VEVRAPREAGERAEIVRRRLAFERDPLAFGERFAEQEQALAARIAAARARLDEVRLPERELLRIAGACAQLGVDGVRGDLVTARAARALAALDGVDEVGESHVRRAAALALPHRRRRDPLDGHQPDPEDVERALDRSADASLDCSADSSLDHDLYNENVSTRNDSDRNNLEIGNPPPRDSSSKNVPTRNDSKRNDLAKGGSSPGDSSPYGDPDDEPPGGAPPGAAAKPSPDGAHADGRAPAPAPAQRQAPPAAARLPAAALELIGKGTGPLGRRARTSGPQAGMIDSRPATAGAWQADRQDVAIAATLLARLLGAPREHVREQVRAGRESALLCLVVDASGSMGARRRLARVKGALLELLRDAYARRDRVGLIAFRARSAEILIAPGAPLGRAAEAIRALPAGGRTPLAAGLDAAARLIANEALREPGRRAIAVVLTDGRAQDPQHEIPRAAARLGCTANAVHVIDIEDGPVRLGLARAMAAAAGASVHRLDDERRVA